MLPPEWIKTKIGQTSQTTAGINPIKYINVSDSNENGMLVIPNRLLDGEATLAELPDEFKLSETVAHPLGQPVMVNIGERSVLLGFDQLDIESSRVVTRWWVYPAAAPLYVVDVTGHLAYLATYFAFEILFFPFT